MGSIIEYIDCPNCKLEAHVDFNYKTGEEIILCSNCGYYYAATITNNEKSLDELTKEDWYIREVKQPYGVYKYKMAGNVFVEMGTLNDEEDANKYRVEMKLEYKDQVEWAMISRVIDGNKEVEWVVGDDTKAGEVW